MGIMRPALTGGTTCVCLQTGLSCIRASIAVCLRGAQLLRCFTVQSWLLLGHDQAVCVRRPNYCACWQVDVLHEGKHGRLQ